MGKTSNMFSLLEDGDGAPKTVAPKATGSETKSTGFSAGKTVSSNGGGRRDGGSRGGRGGKRGGRGREYDRRSGTGRGNRLGYENKKGGGGRGDWGAPGDDGAPAADHAEGDAPANEVEEEPDNELTMGEYMKRQNEKKNKLFELTGGSSAKATEASDFGGAKKAVREEATSGWSFLESEGKSGKAVKARKEKQTITAGFRIKDDGYVPRGGRGGGRGGRGGRGGGRGGMNARLDDAKDFPTLG